MSDAPASAAPDLAADFFDGRRARAHRVRLRVVADRLVIEGEGLQRSVPLAGLRWPERTRHGVRLLQLPDGASLHCADGPAWDAWSARAAGRRDPLVVRVQQRWKWVLASTVLLAGLAVVGYRWGLPWAARAVVALIPVSADEALGEAALAAVDREKLMLPTTLSPDQQRAVRTAFARAVDRLHEARTPAWRLEFRTSTIGPNAFALPGGAIVLTDELYRRVDGDPEVLVGVLGHELGHLRHRDGMRLLVQAGALAAATGALYGDFSGLLAQVPTVLGTASYSRDAEHAADVEAVRLLRANAISPLVMARFFAKLREPAPGDRGAAPESAIPIGLASHPADADRIRFFEQAAADR